MFRNVLPTARLCVRSAVQPVLRSPVVPVRFAPFSSAARQLQQQPKEATQVNAQNVPNLLPLKYEKDIYATVRVHNKPYLVTEGDIVVLPFRLVHAEVGDVLDFNDVTTIGSRNFTYHEDPIPSHVYSIKAVVMEKTKKPMEVKEVTKRRNRHVKHIRSKHPITILRISELKLNV